MNRILNLLHLTDLHFGGDATAVSMAQRHNALQDLIRSLAKVSEQRQNGKSWKPDWVAISGDLTYSGGSLDFRAVRSFLEQLLAVLRVTSDRVVVCPGNHDRDVSRVAGIGYPGGPEEADAWLSPQQFQPAPPAEVRPGNRHRALEPGEVVGTTSPLLAPFTDFVRFCSALGAAKPKGIPGLEYLTGVTDRYTASGALGSDDNAIQFLVLNSAWFSRPGHRDMRNLWLGLPLLEGLESQNVIGKRTIVESSPVRIALVHHPREWLNEEEYNSYSDRPNTYRYLAQRCDIILSGHMHGALEPPSYAHDNAIVFSGGAAYSGHRYRNNFSLLQLDLDDKTVRRRAFEYDPREPCWYEVERARGVYMLRAAQFQRGVQLANDPSCLVGQWKSVFWVEGPGDLRKPTHVVVFKTSRGEEGQKRVIGRGMVENATYLMEGQFESGYLTGTWRSFAPERRHGVFQFRVHEDGKTMTGRWLGFNRATFVNVGSWKFEKTESVVRSAPSRKSTPHSSRPVRRTSRPASDSGGSGKKTG